jgi:hypothetical protein
LTVQFYVYVITDANGRREAVVANDPSDTVMVQAIRRQRELLTFESEAYHLKKWAEENGFTYFSKLASVDIPEVD